MQQNSTCLQHQVFTDRTQAGTIQAVSQFDRLSFKILKYERSKGETEQMSLHFILCMVTFSVTGQNYAQEERCYV